MQINMLLDMNESPGLDRQPRDVAVDAFLVYMPSGGRWPRICDCTCS
jgi:hypothetical protein